MDCHLISHNVSGVVSILVFVELALDVIPVLDAWSMEMGFNPCFRGTCS